MHDTFGVHRLDLFDGYFVVAANLYLGAQFAKVLDEVVSERIVVIEDEDHVVHCRCKRQVSVCLTDVPLIAMLTGDSRSTLKP